MGVAPVGNKKYFTFDGETSKKYNTHITGQGVFNAPVRAVEMINIPNRNGAFALDQGYFENVELTYKASIAADSVAEFSQAVSDLRNWLCSKKGYCRLEDEYNPNEYRMAVYKSGLEVEPFLATSGEFDIVFDCKPQRFLTSGETPISVTSGNTITNPTLFDAKPQLQVKGYGNIDINGADIDIENVPVGNLTVPISPTENTTFSGFTATFAKSKFANGDSVSVIGKTVEITFATGGNYRFQSGYVSNITNCTVTTSSSGTSRTMSVTIPQFDFVVGTSSSGTPSTFDFHWTLNNSGGSGTTTITISTNYLMGDERISYGMSSSSSMTHITRTAKTITGNVSGYSSKTISDTIYVDLEIGEVWAEICGEMTVLNNVTQLPANLPTLVSGANTITYDNTFTSFKVVPRWWQV